MSLAALVLMGAQAPAASVPPPPPACTDAVYSQFDFWVGEWDVYPNSADPAKAPLIAHSRIERLYGGCAVRESWMPLKGAGGGSLNAPDPDTGRWHQYWLDSAGSRVEFDGGLQKPGVMVLTGYWRGVNGPGKHGLIRMTYTRRDDGSVRQFGEISADHGVTWATNFDFIYRPRKSGG